MLSGYSQDPHIQAADNVYTVPNNSAGSILAQKIRDKLISVKIRGADYYNDQTRNLLQQTLHLIPLDDQDLIKFKFHQ